MHYTLDAIVHHFKTHTPQGIQWPEMQNSNKRIIDEKLSENQHLPSKSFSQFFNPRMASIVCRGVIDPNLRDVSLRQMSSGNFKKAKKEALNISKI